MLARSRMRHAKKKKTACVFLERVLRFRQMPPRAYTGNGLAFFRCISVAAAFDGKAQKKTPFFGWQVRQCRQF